MAPDLVGFDEDWKTLQSLKAACSNGINYSVRHFSSKFATTRLHEVLASESDMEPLVKADDLFASGKFVAGFKEIPEKGLYRLATGRRFDVLATELRGINFGRRSELRKAAETFRAARKFAVQGDAFPETLYFF